MLAVLIALSTVEDWRWENLRREVGGRDVLEAHSLDFEFVGGQWFVGVVDVVRHSGALDFRWRKLV